MKDGSDFPFFRHKEPWNTSAKKPPRTRQHRNYTCNNCSGVTPVAFQGTGRRVAGGGTDLGVRRNCHLRKSISAPDRRNTRCGYPRKRYRSE
jgi:hypothetical protein